MVKQHRHFQPEDWDQIRLLEILKQIHSRKILVIGDVGVDRYTVGVVERISDEAPVPIVRVKEKHLKLGLAANVADNIKVLGGEPFLVGMVGNDHFARDFRELLVGEGIDVDYLVEDETRPTVLKERVVGERQQLLRIDYEDLRPVDKSVQDLALANTKKLIESVDAVVIEDYAKGLLQRELVQSVIRLAADHNKLSLVDPNYRPLEDYRGINVLTPNRKEAQFLSRIPIVDESSLLEAGNIILESTQARYVVITLGKNGMAVFSADQAECQRIPTVAREVFDVSGAGDTVIAVMALALSAGASIVEASTLGNVAAGVVVSKRGTVTVTPQEIETSMRFVEQTSVEPLA